MGKDEDIAKIKKTMKTYPDFPKPGILFYDIMPVFADATVHRLLITLLTGHLRDTHTGCDVIVALDARGFLIGPQCALELGVPFATIRKKGKLPGDVHRVAYSLEYGEDVIEISKSAIKPGANVVIIDDLLGTGGTMAAACQLVEKCQAKVSLALVVTCLRSLNGAAKLPRHVPFFALLSV